MEINNIQQTGSLSERLSTGSLNWYGAWTLYSREVKRFLKIWAQTVLGPMMTTMLFLAVFSLAIGGPDRTVAGVPFLEFLAPGLIIMAMMQNSFANSSSSMMMGKVQGNIIDLLMTPMGPTELCLGFIAGGATRGLVAGSVLVIAVQPFVAVTPAHIGFILFHAVAATVMMAALGLLGGLWAEKFDHMSAVTNFVIMPLTFLSGTFYSVERLPALFYNISQFNPFFYAIDGFRYGFIDRADSNVMIGLAVLLAADVVLWALCHHLLARGYKIKP